MFIAYYYNNINQLNPQRIEYILEWNLLEKKSTSQICAINFWALEHHFIENLKLILKENQSTK